MLKMIKGMVIPAEGIVAMLKHEDLAKSFMAMLQTWTQSSMHGGLAKDIVTKPNGHTADIVAMQREYPCRKTKRE